MKHIEDLLEQRYYLNEETYPDLCHRVAKTVASAEKTRALRTEWEAKFYDVLFHKLFLPNSPVLWGAGNPRHTLSACFVIPIEDNIRSIMEAVKRTVMIFKSGGGVGINFSPLRPLGYNISGGGIASGVCTFLEMFNTAGEVIKQGGKRRSAQMSILNVDHPDIMEFINIKSTPGKLTNMNLSVAITDDFMKTATNDDSDEWLLRFNNDCKITSAKEIFNAIAQRAWESGEPGVFFIDAANRDNSCPQIGKIVTTNPCGEVPLRPNEACTLGSINLDKIENNEQLRTVTEIAVRFLDNTIDVNYFPDGIIDNAVKMTRPIGIGIMGLADYFIKNNLVYGSSDSIEAMQAVLMNLKQFAEDYSEKLGYEKGMFPAATESGLQRRNSQLLSIAPTGSISKIANCSPGIEPIFTFASEKRKVAGSDKPMIVKSKWANHPNKEVLVTGKDVSYRDHIYMLAEAQHWVDAGISKTIAMPYESTVEDVKEAIIMAWKLGCKGLTVFREDNGEREGHIKEVCPDHEDTELVRIGKCKACLVCGWPHSCNL